MIRSAAGALVLALVLASCGDDGPSALSPDDLASSASSICRTATKAIDKLDPSDAGAFLEDSVDLFGTASDDLEALLPTARSASDYDDFTSSISKQVKQAKKVSKAVGAADPVALTAAIGALTELATESDSLAEDLDATKCVGIGLTSIAATEVIAAIAATTPPTATTLPLDPTVTTIDPAAVTTLAPVATTRPAITLPSTVAPIATIAPTTLPSLPAVPTVPTSAGNGDTIVVSNAIDDWNAPAGFSFNRDTGDIMGQIFGDPATDPVLGPTLAKYEVGALESADLQVFAILSIITMSTAVSDDQVAAVITFHAADDGAIVTSPGGHTLWVDAAAGDQTFTTIIAILGNFAVKMQLDAANDGVAIMDAFIADNFN